MSEVGALECESSNLQRWIQKLEDRKFRRIFLLPKAPRQGSWTPTDAILRFGGDLMRIDRSLNELHPWRPSPTFTGFSRSIGRQTAALRSHGAAGPRSPGHRAA